MTVKTDRNCLLSSCRKIAHTIKASNKCENATPSKIFGFVITDIVWFNVAVFLYLHASATCGLYLLATGHVSLGAFIFGYLYGIFSAIGVTGGAHRLWSHSSYKAKWPLRLILIILQTAAFQNSVWEWVRDHRVHHKYTDTDADPHNYTRGFFFAHMGWLLMRKHPQVKEKGALIDMSDIEQDALCMFQKRYFLLLMPAFAFILPTYINIVVFELPFWTALHCTNLRYLLSLHFAWLVNSAAHCWGHRPYDSSIRPVNNWLLALVIIGEGWHNYHHVFPWDYKASEYGTYMLNITTCFIDFFSWLGWAYELKSVSQPIIVHRAMRTGDGSYCWLKPTGVVKKTADDHGEMVWGWNDKDLPEQLKQSVNMRNINNNCE